LIRSSLHVPKSLANAPVLARWLRAALELGKLGLMAAISRDRT
jgi:hypothetical protein